MLQGNKRWWDAYWRDVPKLEIPNEKLRFLYQYGMYKFAGLTSPEGVAATLQGAWVEDYQMPPWSNDYHFNINVQMCYWPAYHGNRLEHLRPLWPEDYRVYFFLARIYEELGQEEDANEAYALYTRYRKKKEREELQQNSRLVGDMLMESLQKQLESR